MLDEGHQMPDGVYVVAKCVLVATHKVCVFWPSVYDMVSVTPRRMDNWTRTYQPTGPGP